MFQMIEGAISGTSMKNIWILFNQFQLFIILPFLRTELPLKFIQTLQLLESSILNVNLFDIKTIPVFDTIIEYLDYENPYQEFRENEYESGSAFIN